MGQWKIKVKTSLSRNVFQSGGRDVCDKRSDIGHCNFVADCVLFT